MTEASSGQVSARWPARNAWAGRCGAADRWRWSRKRCGRRRETGAADWRMCGLTLEMVWQWASERNMCHSIFDVSAIPPLKWVENHTAGIADNWDVASSSWEIMEFEGLIHFPHSVEICGDIVAVGTHWTWHRQMGGLGSSHLGFVRLQQPGRAWAFCRTPGRFFPASSAAKPVAMWRPCRERCNGPRGPRDTANGPRSVSFAPQYLLTNRWSCRPHHWVTLGAATLRALGVVSLPVAEVEMTFR